MSRLKVFSIAFFLFTAIGFGYYRNQQINSADNQAPVISMDAESIQVSCSADTTELLQGITASDSKDGDVTDSLIVETMGAIYNNSRQMTVVAFDSDNHASKATRNVIYTDYTSPTFSLKEPLRFPLNTDDIMGTLKCKDVLDGNLTESIKMMSGYYVYTDEAGEYPMQYQVVNSAGDVQTLSATVEIYDPSAEALKPQIVLKKGLVYTSVGAAVNPWDYIKRIEMKGIVYRKNKENGTLYDPNPAENQARTTITSEEVTFTGDVDYNTPGVYEVVITMPNDYTEEEAADPDFNLENITGKTRLIIVVR